MHYLSSAAWVGMPQRESNITKFNSTWRVVTLIILYLRTTKREIGVAVSLYLITFATVIVDRALHDAGCY